MNKPTVRGLLLLLLAAALPLLAQECVYTVTPPSFNVPANEGGGIARTIRIDVNRGGCAWTSRSNVDWITVSFGQSGTNDGTVGIRVEDNRDAITRSGSLTIAGQTVSVLQAAANCAFALNPTSGIASPTGGTGSFQVQTTCNWRAETSVDWIDVTAPAGGRGSGTGTVTYSARANTTNASRTGTIQVGPLRFAIQQQAGTCTQSINPTQVNLPPAGGNGTVQMTSGCAWTAASNAAWIVITGGASGGASGTVAYTVQANTAAQGRTGTVRIGNQTFTVIQAGTGCEVSIAPASVNAPAGGGPGTIAVTGASACTWTAVSGAAWIAVTSGASGTGNGAVGYAVGGNTTGSARSGTIAIGDKVFTVNQAAAGCAVTLSPPGLQVSARGGTGNFLVSAPATCGWAVTPRVPWLTVATESGVGSGTIIYTVAPNEGAARAGAIDVNGQLFTVSQAGSVPVFTAASVVNAASFLSGAVAPGLIVTIFGSGMGPAEFVPANVDPAVRAFPTEIAGTAVLFDGVRAPLIYVAAAQLAAVAPFGIHGQPTTRIEVEVQGVRSAPVVVPVTSTAPGIFTSGASGAGPGAILNPDFTVNSPAFPAAPGSYVSIFATGGGVVTPAAGDGRLSDGLSSTATPVTVLVDGQPAEVSYAGGAPNLVAGLIQVNIRLSPNLRPGNLPIVIRMGETQSQPNVTVSVR